MPNTQSCYSCAHLGVCSGEEELHGILWEPTSNISSAHVGGWLGKTRDELISIITRALSATCSQYLSNKVLELPDA